MNRLESVEMIGRLSAYIPTLKLSEVTVKVWAAEIEHFSAEAGREGVRELARNVRKTPALADLIEAISHAERRLEVERKALESPQEVDPERNASNLARLKEMLSKIGRTVG